MKVGIICITKAFNLPDFKEWVDWHINHCKFHKIIIVDNESHVDIKSICDEHPEIEYHTVTGRPQQYKIYDQIANDRNLGLDWFIPIDDDEYFWFDPNKYNSITDVIESYSKKVPFPLCMLAVRWKFGWPEDLFKTRDKTALAYCTNLSDDYSTKIVGKDIAVICKTLVKTNGRIHYQTSEENPNGGHIPIHSKMPFAAFYNGQPVFNNKSIHFDKFEDEDIRIIHLKFKSYDDFKAHIMPKISGKDNKLKNLDKRILKFINKNANA